MKLFFLITAVFLTGILSGAGKVVEYALEIGETIQNPAGKPIKALTINGQLPGPILRFRVGDIARIHVRNALASGEVSTHWHGPLVPNLEDGVPYLTTPPIFAGAARTFEFTLKNPGTYWYHSHTGLQKQRGVYGAIVIEPRGGERIKADREEVVVLSDWTNESPEEVMRTLMRGSDWYNVRKGMAQSILGAVKAGESAEYWRREKSRLPPMDVSDIAYDAFLLNGRPRQNLPARPGERIRLRVINAAASTYFYLHSAAGPLQIVAADGMDVKPIRQQRLLMGIAETYDLLFTVPRAGAWEFRATSQDGTGHASLFIGRGPEREAPAMERLNPYSMNDALSTVLDALDEKAPRSDREALAAEKSRPLPPYQRLESARPTNLPRSAPVRKITLTLNGDMTRYLWTINGTTLTEDSSIPVKRGEIIQIEFRNDSMMHHPMHLHGHFFRLLMDGGPDPLYAPLKNVVDVPPMSRRLIEFYANEEKDWAIHCHLLYHMHAGMMKVISYDDQGPDHQPALDLKSEDPYYFTLDGSVQTNMSMGMASLMDARDEFAVMWETGWGHETEPHLESHGEGPEHSHGETPEVEYEVDLLYQRYINPYWTVFAGYRLTNMPEKENAAVVGATHLLPYMVEATLSVESSGDARLGLGKTFQLTSRLSSFVRAEYDTGHDFMWMAGANYILTKQLGLTASWDSDYGFGAGLSFRF